MGILPDWMIEDEVKITPMEPCRKRPGVLSYGITSYGYDARVGYKFRVFSPVNVHGVQTEIDPKAFDERCLVDVDLTPGREKPHDWEDRPDKATYVCRDCGTSNPAASKGLGCPVKVQPFIHIPPHSFLLAETVEHIEIPRSVLCVVVGKSTYARCGITVPLTPLEPEWRGKVTVEISNTTPLPARVYPGEGIMQLLFFRSDGFRHIAYDHFLNHLSSEHGHMYGPTMGNHDFLHGPGPRRSGGTCRESYADKKGIYQDQGGIVLPGVAKEEGK